MIPTKPVVLKGKAAKDFEEYQRRPATKEEIKYFRDAEKFYLDHCLETEPSLSKKKKQ